MSGSMRDVQLRVLPFVPSPCGESRQTGLRAQRGDAAPAQSSAVRL